MTSGLFSSLMKLLPKDCRSSVCLNPREQHPRVAEVLVIADSGPAVHCPPAHMATVPVAGDFVAT